MSRIVDDLLALARLESPHLSWEKFELSALVSEVIEEQAPRAREKQISLTAHPGGPARVCADRDEIKRALANLLDNAVRYSPGGTSVALASGTSDGWAWFAVKDEGPGIPREHQDRVFDRFHRVDSARSRAVGGSGLGLAIVRQIAEAHGGRAGVASEPGAGATFFVYLPQLEAKEAGTGPAPTRSPL